MQNIGEIDSRFDGDLLVHRVGHGLQHVRPLLLLQELEGDRQVPRNHLHHLAAE
jgi:hypothetical protein